ncbi:hypothetical protein GMA11_04305 [Granulicatella sp. zg-ZJ]|uniref:hypothetical protein n=2 Tax=unclassified Granulicatella TaxID=2630493 RepID=UPI0013BEBBBA|nr:hypothetical protein [Granulicatella sp. zg-ZJ]MBS4750737.1 hypothetical protein [Carnobacteriaceae bacterium zg-ZUI78]NEW62611.1 hypothetical protein [Granulicatella sp. zg-ZJ]NEW66469.1 hypothetical protein [Granulicatella sp. zg-84]QMI86012.1 hypothetical protein H1220_01170 [Carnobacteriaceae bacterium zg-84]
MKTKKYVLLTCLCLPFLFQHKIEAATKPTGQTIHLKTGQTISYDNHAINGGIHLTEKEKSLVDSVTLYTPLHKGTFYHYGLYSSIRLFFDTMNLELGPQKIGFFTH